MGRVSIDAINEGTSSANSKLNDFIKNVPTDVQKQIKGALNIIYLGLKSANIEYEEYGKPLKGTYKSSMVHGGYGDSKNDQLTWKLKTTFDPVFKGISYSWGDYLVAIDNLVKKAESSVNGAKPVTDFTNKDSYKGITFSDVMVAVGKPSSSAYWLDENKKCHGYLMIKIVVPHVEEVADTSGNDALRKAIMTKVKKMVPNKTMPKVGKALDAVYDVCTSLSGGYIEGKRASMKSAEINVSEVRYEPDLKPFDAVVWKVSLLGSTKYNFHDNEIMTKVGGGEDTTSVTVDGNTYACVKVEDCYVGIHHEYGSRSKEFVYFAVLSPQNDKIENSARKTFDATGNKYASKDGLGLSNDLCFVSYNRSKKEMNGGDKTDPYNEPRFYTTKKVGLDKAWSDLLNEFDAKTTMNEVENIIWRYSATRSYCAMD